MTEFDAAAPPPPGGQPMYPQYGYPVPPPRFRALRGLAIALQGLLAAQVVATGLGIAATLNERSVIDRLRDDADSVSTSEIESTDGLTSAAGLLQALLYLATAVVWIIWLYKARKNVDDWDADGQRLGAGWAIGGWFVPLGNLVLPAIVTKDVGVGTSYDAGQVWQRSRYPLAVIWGIAFAAMNVMSSISYYKSRNIDRSADVTLDDITSYESWDLAAQAVTLVAIGIAVALVRSITERQTDRITRTGKWAQPGVSAQAG